MMQEVWITIRLKGEMDAAHDANAVATELLQHLEQCLILREGLGTQPALGFSYCQPGDVIEVEEEARIYGNESEA